MLSKLEKELKKIAEQILNSDRFTDFEEISNTVSTLYEKVILYKYLNKNQQNNLKENDIILNEEFETLKNYRKVTIEPNFYSEKDIIGKKRIEKKIAQIQRGKNDSNEMYSNRDKKNIKNINDQFARKLKIDFNDKNAFIKHLFNEDKKIYNEIITKIEKLSDFEEVKKVIKKVKIDHNNWRGKQVYEKSFVNLIHKNFI